MEDIRNRPITIKVNNDDDCTTTIERYLEKTLKLKLITKKCKDLEITNWYSKKYSQIHIASMNYNSETEEVTFKLDGNRHE